MAELRFPKRLRLLATRDFDRVMRGRASATDALVRIHGAVNDLGYPRLGLITSRRVGGAVQRNAWRRALREAFRLAQHELPPCDLVCIPQRDATPDVKRLMQSLPRLANRIASELGRRRKQ